MQGKNIILGISGGIAAYKATTIASNLCKKGANVQVIMTESATKIISPLTFQTITKNHVYVDTFDDSNSENVAHINIADNADLVVIAPATANVIAKMAYGIADNMLTTTLLAVHSPIIIAPSMNVNMYNHPTVQNNIAILKSRNINIIEPAEGLLAEGYSGKGRLPEPEEIVEYIDGFIKKEEDFSNIRFLITAGATKESIDPVRYITNHSTGKMGNAIAKGAADRGGDVILISAASNISVPEGVELVPVTSAEEMYNAVMEHLESVDVIIKAAAVADYCPKVKYNQKIKKKDGNLIIEMERTKDIALEIGKRKKKEQYFIGFSAETENLLNNAKQKLEKKNMNMIVANNILTEGAGFGVDTNIVSILTESGKEIDYPLLSKSELADCILSELKSDWEG